MSSNKNKSLLEFTTDEPDQGTNTTETTNESTEPKGNHTEEKDEVNHICDRYAEERTSERWQELKEEYSLSEPKCGHAIAYLREDIESKIAISTGRDYATQLKYFVRFLHKNNKSVINAEFKEVDRFFKDLAARGLTESTLSGYRTAIANLLKYIRLFQNIEPNVKWDMIHEGIKPSEYQTSEGFDREPLEKEEVKKLYDELEFRDKLMVQVGVELGPRNADIRRIKLEDVDLDDNMILLHDTKNKDTYESPITSGLSLLLRRWINVERAQIPHSSETNYLFPSHKGGKLTGNSFAKIVREKAWDAGIQEVVDTAPLREKQKEILDTDKDCREFHRVTPHTLRHTFSNLLKDAGLPIKERSKALNHDNTITTEEFYDEDERDYKELMRRLFSGVDLQEENW